MNIAILKIPLKNVALNCSLGGSPRLKIHFFFFFYERTPKNKKMRQACGILEKVEFSKCGIFEIYFPFRSLERFKKFSENFLKFKS